ncbi:murein hydrolase activator EnvC family protein [Aneurinibacillus tyrosinisolvens]|uniref:murein hydrolase activator EnvC family protein n=1 Tax=Aneurinibacillus tyrosinisolvens TaxID=1443435 RepID=UPI00063EEEE0|nr:peptidoglycan DD-metalloendopeptidase family protein [Aneurinibacillus tyrosinisolvens]
MTKKFLIPLATAVLLTTLSPVTGYANKVAEVKKQISQIQQQSQAAKIKVNEIDKQIASVQAQQQDTQEDIMSIDLKMNETQGKIDELNRSIKMTTGQAEEAAKDLQAAIERVEKRDTLLKTRVSAIYEAGDISYLEVLLGSKDFADFLDRLDAVKSIVDQDVTILEDNKRDRDIIEQKKKEIETNLANLKRMQAETLALSQELEKQKQEKERILKELEAKEGDLVEIKDDQEQASLALVNELQQKIEEKRRLEAQRHASNPGDTSWTPPAVHSGGAFYWPVAGARISSVFGYRIHPILHYKKFHDGTDFAAPQGTPIHAVAAGTVASAGYMNGYGNAVVIYHGNGLSTLYGHIRNGGILVKEGQQVTAGQVIAEVGSTGRSTGPHLHLTVIQNGTKVDPMAYFN